MAEIISEKLTIVRSVSIRKDQFMASVWLATPVASAVSDKSLDIKIDHLEASYNYVDKRPP
jgi:hypothetical protein